MELNKIHNIDCLAGLKMLADKSVHCIVTSPGYWMLRDYGVKGQVGQEPTPKRYINRLVRIFTEAKRVLRDDGVLWINIGDSYAPKKIGNIKAKDMVGIPWMLVFALRNAGYFIRQDIIWSKPNPMPESVTDRCTKSHEYLFMLTKSAKYYYDSNAIRTEAKESSIKRLSQDIDGQTGSNRVPGKTNGAMKAVIKTDKQRGHSRKHAGFNERWDGMSVKEQMSMGANKRSVWEVATMPFSDAHFATFPEALIIDCIKSGCPPDGTVLDPFMGAGTTALVAQKLGRHFIGFELNPKYVTMANKRLNSHLGMFSPENLKAIEQSSIQLTIE